MCDQLVLQHPERDKWRGQQAAGEQLLSSVQQMRSWTGNSCGLYFPVNSCEEVEHNQNPEHNCNFGLAGDRMTYDLFCFALNETGDRCPTNVNKGTVLYTQLK